MRGIKRGECHRSQYLCQEYDLVEAIAGVQRYAAKRSLFVTEALNQKQNQGSNCSSVSCGVDSCIPQREDRSKINVWNVTEDNVENRVQELREAAAFAVLED
jgi:hypothetical protein